MCGCGMSLGCRARGCGCRHCCELYYVFFSERMVCSVVLESPQPLLLSFLEVQLVSLFMVVCRKIRIFEAVYFSKMLCL